MFKYEKGKKFDHNKYILKSNYYHNHYYHPSSFCILFRFESLPKTHTLQHTLVIIIITNKRGTRNQLKTMAVKLL